MDTATLTLTDFLLARIAEDEGDAHYLRNVGVNGVQYGTVNEMLEKVTQRVLADCEAKRRIVAEHRASTDYEYTYCLLCQWDICCDGPKQDYHRDSGTYPCPTLRALALPYADHPDYRDDWKP